MPLPANRKFTQDYYQVTGFHGTGFARTEHDPGLAEFYTMSLAFHKRDYTVGKGDYSMTIIQAVIYYPDFPDHIGVEHGGMSAWPQNSWLDPNRGPKLYAGDRMIGVPRDLMLEWTLAMLEPENLVWSIDSNGRELTYEGPRHYTMNWAS